MWTLWGPGKVSCLERRPHFRGKFVFKNACLGHRKVSLIQRGISGVSIKRGSTLSYMYNSLL